MYLRLWMNRIKSWKQATFLAFKLLVEKNRINLYGICHIFLEQLTTFVSELDRHVSS